MEPLRDDDPTGVGEYRFLGVLGAGGMGRVFLGADRSGKLAAVKVVHDGLAEDPGFRARFAREVETARLVSATGVSDVLAGDTEADRPWLATEYVPGPSLEQAIERAGPFAADQVAVLAAGLATALAGLHAAGLVHRDLKPSNVMLAPDGPRLIDFGIARAADATRITHTGMLLGTPGYMSPEQASADPVGAASDVFSLASVLVFAATGRGPFGETANPVAMLLRILRDEPELGGVAESLRPVLLRCLAKDPARRPSAAELLVELTVTEEQLASWPPPVVQDRTEQLNATVAGARPPSEVRTTTVDHAVGSGSGPTQAVRTVVVPAREPRRGGNRALWLGLGGGVAVAAVVGVAVFGSGTAPLGTLDTPAALSAAIDDRIRDAGTLRSTGSLEATWVNPNEPSTLRYQAQLRVDGDQVWYSSTGTVHHGPIRQVGKEPLPAGDTEFGEVLLPGHLWILAPARPGPAKRPWTDHPLGSTAAADKAITDIAKKSNWTYANPLRWMVRATTVTDIQAEELDGLATTKYTLRADPAALAQLSVDQNWQPSVPLSSDPESTATVTFWLDGQNRLVRYRSRKPANSEWTNTSNQDMRYFGWGDPVQINPPPPDQVELSGGS